jgi:transposase
MQTVIVDQKAYQILLDEHNQLKIAYTALQQQILQLQKMIFGSKHERFVPNDSNPSQLLLDINAEQTASCSVVDAKKIT